LYFDKQGGEIHVYHITKDTVTSLYFKTCRENTKKYLAQMKNSLVVISEVYGKPAKPLLAYVDLNKVVPV
jgi:hypothetical protein